MKNTLLKFSFISLLLFGFSATSAQQTVTIGSEALNEKAVLTLVTATGDQGFILPVVQDRNAINPDASEKGMLVYDNTSSKVYLWNGSSWLDITAAGSGGVVASLNDIADVNAAAPTAGQVLQFQPGTGWVAASVSVTDTDDQGLVLAGDMLTIEDGAGTIDLSAYRQDISFNPATNELTISDGSTITIPSGGTDADADPSNEIQSLSLAGTTINISGGVGVDIATLIPPGGTDDQTAAEVIYSNTTSGLTAGDVQAAIDELAAGGTLNTDNQELFYNSTDNTLRIDRGNTVDLSDLAGGGLADDWGAQVVQHDNSLKGDGTTGSPLGLAQQTAANGQVLKWDGTNWTPANDNVASGSGGAVNTSPRLIGDGTTASPLDIASQGADPGQVLKWDGSTWTPAADNEGAGGGATYTAGDGISIDASNVISNIGDADSDLTNEIQNLTLTGSIINISGGTGVDIGSLIPAGGTDDQNLIMTDDVLSIEGGTGSVDLNTYRNDADSDPTNEIDVTNMTGLLTGNGTEVSGLVGTADGQIPKWNAGASIWEAGTDATAVGSSLWNEITTGISYNAGFVGIETNDPTAKLDVNGDIRTRALSGMGERNVVADALGNLKIGAGGSSYTAGEGIAIAENVISNTSISPWSGGAGNISYFGRVRIGDYNPIRSNDKLQVESDGGNGISSYLKGYGILIGIKANVEGLDETLTFGMRTDVRSNTATSITGHRTDVRGTGSGEKRGYYVNFYETGTGTSYGFKSSYYPLTLGTGEKYGVFTEYEDKNYFSGKVGIGTEDPRANLQVKNVYNTGQPFLELETSGGDRANITFSKTGSSGNWDQLAGIRTDPSSATMSYYYNETGYSQNVLTLRGDGKVGINKSNPSVALDVSGDIHYTGSITDVSDRRLKENISKIDSALLKILSINGYSYNMINDSKKIREYGVIAQEVQEVMPLAVSILNENEDYLGVAYPQLVPVVIEAIKEQQNIINSQKTKIDELEKRLLELEELIKK